MGRPKSSPGGSGKNPVLKIGVKGGSSMKLEMKPPKIPDFSIDKKTPKALKSGLERYLKKLTLKERKILNRYVFYVLEKYDNKLKKEFRKKYPKKLVFLIDLGGAPLKMSLKARVAMAQILKKIGRRGEYYVDRYIRFLKLKLKKEYQDRATGKPKGKAPKKTPPLDDLPPL